MIILPERAKIEVGYRRIQRLSGLDELAEILFPGNRSHQRTCLAIFIELKYAKRHFLPSLAPIVARYRISRRTLEKVRAKMKRMGIIARVSQFSPKHGYQAGWELSSRFARSLEVLAALVRNAQSIGEGKQSERRDRKFLNLL